MLSFCSCSSYVFLPSLLALTWAQTWVSTGDEKRTTSVAWGDWDGDGDLDLVFGNYDESNQIYENDNGSLKLDLSNGLGWQELSGQHTTNSVAWGDWDGDSDLDLAIGNVEHWMFGGLSVENQIYENDHGTLELSFDSFRQPTWDIAWGDWDDDGDLDLAVGNEGVNQIYENTLQGESFLPDNTLSLDITGPYTANANLYAASMILDNPIIPITYALFNPEGDLTGNIDVFYSPDGGGRWLPAVAAKDTITTHLSTGYWLKRAVLTPTQAIPNTGVPFYASMNITDSALVNATVAEVEAWVWITHTLNADLALTLQSPSGTQIPLFTAGQATGQNFDHTYFSDYVTMTLIVSDTAPYTGTYHPAVNLADLKGQSIQGTWALVITDSVGGGSGTLNAWGLRIKTPPVPHVYTWDTFASGFFGQSDNVVLRMVAYPQLATSADAGEYKYYNSTSGPFQRPYASATTFPFRVRGTQVRVLDEESYVQQTVIDDFEQGLPLGADGYGNAVGFASWGDVPSNTTLNTTVVLSGSHPLAVPGQPLSNTLLQIDYDIDGGGWGGFTHAFENEATDTWVSHDWTPYTGMSFWLYGNNVWVSFMNLGLHLSDLSGD